MTSGASDGAITLVQAVRGRTPERIEELARHRSSSVRGAVTGGARRGCLMRIRLPIRHAFAGRRTQPPQGAMPTGPAANEHAPHTPSLLVAFALILVLASAASVSVGLKQQSRRGAAGGSSPMLSSLPR
jgi:hypothetical protein